MNNGLPILRIQLDRQMQSLHAAVVLELDAEKEELGRMILDATKNTDIVAIVKDQVEKALRESLHTSIRYTVQAAVSDSVKGYLGQLAKKLSDDWLRKAGFVVDEEPDHG